MRQKGETPGSPAHWLARAKADLALAQIQPPEGGLYEDLCFHAQQAAEKALKAVYIAQGWPFRYVHVLEELITGLRTRGLQVPDEVAKAVRLTDYAFSTRYPGPAEPVSKQEHAQAVELANMVVQWAKATVEKRTS